MEQRLTIIGLGVRDLQASSKFYDDVFGWQRTDSSNDNIVFYQMNGMLLSLYSRDKLAEDAGISPEGIGFKAFSVAYNTRSREEVDQLFQRYLSMEVTIVKQPEDVFWGGYSGYIADPDENLWEIAYNPYLELDEAGNTV